MALIEFEHIQKAFGDKEVYKDLNLVIHRGEALTIIVGTDRPLGYKEVSQQARSLEYNVSLVQLKKDEEGKWTGAFAPAEKLSWNEKTASFKAESWQTKPTMLMGIRELD